MFEDFTTYNMLKYTHIFSAFLLFGTGLGSAFYKLMADRAGNITVQAAMSRYVVWADWLFTTPSGIFQFISGLWLLSELGISWSEPWALIAIGLYVFAGICWLPVVWIQIQHAEMAETALAQGTALPDRYHRLQKIWFWLGWPAFFSLTIAVWLMITKPVF